MATEEYLRLRAEQGEPKEYSDGFGLKAILGGLFVAFLVVPGSMFMWLMLGAELSAAAVWVTLIVMLEIAKRCRTTLSRQEMFIIHSVTIGMMGAATGQFFNFIWMQYFIRSDAAIQFEIVNRLPFWVAPPPGSGAYITKNLLHPDWWPMLILMAIGILWSRISFFSLGYVLFRLTSDVERLPFPLVPIAAKGITALAESEQETWRWKCFSIGSTVGIAFGLIYVAIPTLSGVFLKKPVYLLPVPFYDLTTKLQEIKWFRAVPLAVSTNLGMIFTGFVLPFWMVMGTFCAGILGRLVVNPLLFKWGVLQRWQPGMDYIETGIANRFDFWLSFTIGTAMAVAVLGVYEASKAVVNLKRSKEKDSSLRLFAPPKGRGDIPIPIAILFYIATTTWTIVLCHYLVPKFPVWILIAFGFGYSPLMSYISARLQGLTGARVAIPYVREATFVLSGYKGIDIWRAPIPLADHGASAAEFRRSELTGTKFSSVYKAQFFTIPVSIVVSLFFWSFIHKMSDIPEDYPYAMRFWPPRAINDCFWWTATTSGNAFFLDAFRWKFVMSGLAYGLIAYPVLRLFHAPTLFLYGTINGLAYDPINAIPMFAAALIGRFYMARIFGKRQWAEYTPILAAGFGCGIGLVGMMSMGVRLISSAITMLPF